MRRPESEAKQKHVKIVARPELPIQKIFKDHLYHALDHCDTYEQQNLVWDIAQCHTADKGTYYGQCDNCGAIAVSYGSCGNSQCPNCGMGKAEIWKELRMGETVDTVYYHVVFTVPAELNKLFVANWRFLLSLLHYAVSRTLLELAADPKYLGAVPGIIQVLQTWGARMNLHPHIHCIVTGGGLSFDGTTWVPDKCKGFLFPVALMSEKFRAHFLEGLKKMYAGGKLELSLKGKKLFHCDQDWDAFIDFLYRKEWVAYIKGTPLEGGQNAIEYLARYINKICITNSRIVKYDGENVTFRYKDYADNNTEKTMTVPAWKFIQMFLQHTLPKYFCRTRYYGFLANSVRAKNVALIKKLQGKSFYEPRFDSHTPVKEVYDILFKEKNENRPCSCCKIGRIISKSENEIRQILNPSKERISIPEPPKPTQKQWEQMSFLRFCRGHDYFFVTPNQEYIDECLAPPPPVPPPLIPAWA